MEALAIFGIACNVLQVIGSAEQAIRLGRSLYESGSVDPELARGTAALRTCMRDLSSHVENSTEATSPDAKDLIAIAKECLDLGGKIEEKLQKIAGVDPAGSKRRTVRGWFAAVKRKRKLENLEKDMRNRQHVLETKLLVRICKKSEASDIRDQSSFSSLNSTLQSFIIACTQGQATLDQVVKSQSESIKVHVADEAKRTRLCTKNNIAVEFYRVENNISSTLQALQVAEASRENIQRLLASLHFPSMGSRRTQIKDSHEETFEWIFKPRNHVADEDLKVHWSDFTSWLRADKSPLPYWISGKAGSGKSTLMKFLAGHEQTYDILNAKSGEAKILSHYLWEAGDLLQRNVTGFLRSMLYQVLGDSEQLISSVISSSDYAKRREEIGNWSNRQLEAVLEHSFSVSPDSFCLFLDGVDEAEDQITLIELVRRISNLGQVRVCVSSRPEPVLRKYFHAYPSLRVQDLTALDIRKFVSSMLGRSIPSFGNRLDEFTDRICGKADGVFLWAALATKSLKFGACYGEGGDALTTRLDHLPRDVEEMYAAMWRRESEKNPAHQENAARCLRAMLEYTNPPRHQGLRMDITLMTLTVNPTLATAFIHDPSERMARRVSESCVGTLKDLDLRTGGLLEVTADNEVTFIHQSASTFLRESALAGQILDAYKMTPQEQRGDRILGLLAYTLICAGPNSWSENRVKGYAVDNGNPSVLCQHELTGEIQRTWPSYEFQFCRNQILLLANTFLGWLMEYAFNQQFHVAEVRHLLSVAQTVHRSGRWPCLFWAGGSYRSLDFMGAAAALGMFDFVNLSMAALYAASPACMKVSADYEDYILRFALYNTYGYRATPARALQILQLIADNTPRTTSNNASSAESRESHRFLIENDVLSEFIESSLGPAPHWDHRFMRRALLGLFYAGLRPAGSRLLTLTGYQDFPVDTFMPFEHHNELLASFSNHRYLRSSDKTRSKNFILFQTNPKTMLLLFLAGATDRSVNGAPIFTMLTRAAEDIDMPFLLRIVALGPHTRAGENFQDNENAEGSDDFRRNKSSPSESSGGDSDDDGYLSMLDVHSSSVKPRYKSADPRRIWRVPVDFGSKSRDGKTYQYKNLEAIRHSMAGAGFSSTVIDGEWAGREGPRIVMPGLDRHIQEIAPVMRKVTSEELAELLLQEGLVAGNEGRTEWPPQPYCPIDPEMGTERTQRPEREEQRRRGERNTRHETENYELSEDERPTPLLPRQLHHRWRSLGIRVVHNGVPHIQHAAQ